MKFDFKGENVFILIDNENEPWFKAKNTAKNVDYNGTDQARRANVDKYDRLFM